MGCANRGTNGDPWATLSSSFHNRFSTAELTYRNPPRKGAWLQPQAHLVTCLSEQLAITMALTGFFLDGCELLQTARTHQVASVTKRDFGNDQLVWIAVVMTSSGTVWVPVPWHDWA